MRLFLAALCFVSFSMISATQAQERDYFIVKYERSAAGNNPDAFVPTQLNNAGQVLARGLGDLTDYFIFTSQRSGFTVSGTAGQKIAGFNSAGDVGGSRMIDGRRQAGAWNRSAGFVFQAVPGIQGASDATDINDFGDLLLESLDLATNQSRIQIHARFNHHPLAAGLTPMPRGTQLEGAALIPKALGNAGEIAGNTVIGGVKRGFFWKPGMAEAVPLAGLPQAASAESTVFDISPEGDIVGSALDSSGVRTPVRWQAGSLSPQRLMALTAREGQALSAGGNRQIVGWFEFSAGVRHAFVWREGTFTDLNLQLPEGSSIVLQEAQSTNLLGGILCKASVAGISRTIALIPASRIGLKIGPSAEFLGGTTGTIQLEFTPPLAGALTFDVRQISDSTGAVDPIGTLSANPGPLSNTLNLITRPVLTGQVERVILRAQPELSFDPRDMGVAEVRLQPIKLEQLVVSPASLKGGQTFNVGSLLTREARAISPAIFGQAQARLVVTPPGAVRLNRTEFTVIQTSVSNVGGVTESSLADQTVKIDFHFLNAQNQPTVAPIASTEFTILAVAISDAAPQSQPKWNNTVNYRIRLDAPAPRGGARLTLSASDLNMFQVPATVTIPAGQSEIVLPVKSGIGALPVDHRVDITLRGLKKTFTHTVVVKPF